MLSHYVCQSSPAVWYLVSMRSSALERRVSHGAAMAISAYPAVWHLISMSYKAIEHHVSHGAAMGKISLTVSVPAQRTVLAGECRGFVFPPRLRFQQAAEQNVPRGGM